MYVGFNVVTFEGNGIAVHKYLMFPECVKVALT